eukprot:775295-Amphidinium_carterae.1
MSSQLQAEYENCLEPLLVHHIAFNLFPGSVFLQFSRTSHHRWSLFKRCTLITRRVPCGQFVPPSLLQALQTWIFKHLAQWFEPYIP